MDKITEAIADFNADTVENRAKRRISCTKGHKHVLEVEREDGFPLHFCTHCCSWID